MRFWPAFVLAACASVSQAQAPTAGAPEYADYHGTWRGAFLFSAEEATGRPGAPPRVHNGTIELAADGAVRGAIADAGCTLAGNASAFVSAANATLELTLSSCRDLRFNGRFNGTLINNPQLRYASVRLAPAGRSSDDGSTRLSAIVRR